MKLFPRKKSKQVGRAEAAPERKPKAPGKNIKKRTVAIHSRAFRILRYPLVTEKVTALGQLNKYVFEVDQQANKQAVKKAIEEIYGVHVEKVNILNRQGKQRRYGRAQGRTRARKKAIITLKAGETIQIFEGV